VVAVSPKGPAVGLGVVDAVAGDPRLARTHLLPATRADLLRRLGRSGEAADAYRAALALARTAPERAFLQRRLEEVAHQCGGYEPPH
jgi:RNA polymerase sigma-70 factor, ECF subfamily